MVNIHDVVWGRAKKITEKREVHVISSANCLNEIVIFWKIVPTQSSLLIKNSNQLPFSDLIVLFLSTLSLS